MRSGQKFTTPLPLWEALDAIGRAGKVRHDPGSFSFVASNPPLLHIADGEPPSNALYRGPFRLHVVGLHRRRDLDLGTSFDRRPGTRGVLCLDLQAFVEPGRFIDSDGSPRFEASDDLGHAIPTAPAEAEQPRQTPRGWQVPGATGLVEWPLSQFICSGSLENPQARGHGPSVRLGPKAGAAGCLARRSARENVPSRRNDAAIEDPFRVGKVDTGRSHPEPGPKTRNQPRRAIPEPLASPILVRGSREACPHLASQLRACWTRRGNAVSHHDLRRRASDPASLPRPRWTRVQIPFEFADIPLP